MIFDGTGYKLALKYTAIISAGLACVSFFISPYFDIDMGVIIRMAFAILSAIIIGVFAKKIYDAIEAIVNFKLDDEAPVKIIDLVTASQNAYTKALKQSFEIKAYPLTYLALFLLVIAKPTLSSEVANRAISCLSISLFFVFNYFFVVFLIRLNSTLYDFKSSLDARANMEARRKSILETLAKTKSSIEAKTKEKQGYSPNKNFDVQAYIEKLKAKETGSDEP